MKEVFVVTHYEIYDKHHTPFVIGVGSISKMECYNDFISMLKSLSSEIDDEDGLLNDLHIEQKGQM